MNDEVQALRARIAAIGRLLFDRHLTDAAGGNISARSGDYICISASASGGRRQWQLEPSHVLVTDREGRILAGEGQVSREANAHYRLHREFGDVGTAVIHAHARHLLVFAALNQPLPPVLEANLKFGEVPCIPYAPAKSEELAANIAAALAGRRAQIKTQAAGVIAPWHGLFLVGKDLDAAFDAVERYDTNARIILQSRAMGLEADLLAQSENLKAAAAAFGKEL